MRPLRTFTVQPSLPEPLKPLLELAHNLFWTWQGSIRDLFRRLDSQGWEDSYHNPVAMLGNIDQQKLIAAANDEGFMAHLKRAYAELQDYLSKPGWWSQTYGGDRQPQVAYFCAEFGITESLPIYSGGLGVLAGDHLKSASELGIPLVGVGLLYQQGYFRQRLNADGWQLELFPRNDFHNMPVELLRSEDGNPVTVEIEMPEKPVLVQVWLARVGRVKLFLLDTNIAGNSPEHRQITAQLYGGDQEMRIRQEIVLGIGGVRALRAVGINPKAFHMNEGHAAFLSLERIRMLMAETGVSFAEAREAVAASNVFTTHTPVPAGHDAFEPWLIDKYFDKYWHQLGISREDFLAQGRQDPKSKEEPMSLTVLATRMSTYRNGVSELHGQVSRTLWTGIWPGIPVDEVPIQHITNGIHTRSWISNDLASLYDRYLGPGWTEKPADMAIWKTVENIPDTELWRTHERRKERLVSFCRERLSAQLAKRGAGSAEIAAASEILDPEALTIVFARRFATYKRASLILSDLDRLSKLLNNPDKPVQIIFAGKAHPRDNPGKDLIRKFIHTARKEEFRRSLVFIEDYDINVARYLVQGTDVWLNTPLRPMEASGTSGMKVAANGGLNLSILDGWWAEGYSTDVGWAIGSGETYDDIDYQNAVESQAIYDTLEKETVPLFYSRGPDKLPRGWIAKMKAAMSKLAPVYNTNRMLKQYAEMSYAKAAQRGDELTGNEMAGAKELSGWKQKVFHEFDGIRIDTVSDNMNGEGGAFVGKDVTVEAVVDLGGLGPEDVRVELYFGPLGGDGQLDDGQVIPMEQVENEGDNRVKYTALMPCSKSGMTGYTVRVMPCHTNLVASSDMALIRWA